jgi:CRP-like cAMP-binding protein
MEGTAKPNPQMLEAAPLFAALSPRSRQDLADAGRILALGPGQPLWRQGQPAAMVGLVIAGRCKLVRETPAREVIVDVALPGDLLGAIGFATESDYSTTVVCLRRARVLLVPASLLRAVLVKESHAVAALAAGLARDVSRLMRMIQNLSAGSVQRRLASVLLDLATRSGEPFPGGVTIPVRLQRKELAALAATTLESASRTISAWRRRGLIALSADGYQIPDLEALKAVAAGE